MPQDNLAKYFREIIFNSQAGWHSDRLVPDNVNEVASVGLMDNGVNQGMALIFSCGAGYTFHG